MSEEKRVKSYIKPDKEKADSMIRERLKNIKEEDDIVVTEAETDKVIETKSDKVDKPEETKTEAKAETKEAESKKTEAKKAESDKAEAKKLDTKNEKKTQVASKNVNKSAAVAVPQKTDWMTSSKKAILITAIGLFALFLFIQLKYIYEIWFDPDEMDVYSVGFEMAKGKVLYRDIPSQHMPWTYIFSAFFYLLGAHTATIQRVFFYVMFAGFWTYFVFAYRKYVNKWVLILTPFVYHGVLQHIDFATQILSEHLVVIGGQIFLLELLMFLKKKDISTASCIRMSIAVLFTFGSAFISIFPLFFLGLGVLALEIKWRVQNGTSRGEWWSMMLKRYLKLFFIVAIPWIILVIYMIATGSFHDFGFGAYTINRLYYPQYMNGLGSGTFSTFVTALTAPSSYLLGFTPGDLSIVYAVELFMVCCGFYMAYKIWRSDGLIAALAVYFFVYSFGSRGFYNYHGTAFVGVIALVTVYVLVTYAYKNKEHFLEMPMIRRGALCTVVAMLTLAYIANFQMVMSFTSGAAFNYYQSDTDIVKTILSEDERIWQTNVCDTISYTAERLTDGPSVSTPWMWDAVGTHQIDEFMQNPTKAVIFQLGYESWGHKMADYAPEAYYYIVNNYKYLPSSSQIWVRADFYDEACRLTGIDPDTVENDNGLSVTPFSVDPSEMPGMTKEDREEAVRKAQEAAEKGETDEEEEEEEKEEVTTEEKTEATTEATTEEEIDDGPIIVEPEDNDTNDVNDDTSSSVETTDYGPTTTTTSGNGPGDVTVSPADEMGGSSNTVTQDTPGAVQAPDGSWVIQDDSDGPGM